MKLLKFFILGTLVQAAGLLLFILVSRSRLATLGKPAIITIFMIGMVLVIWRSVVEIAGGLLCLLPILLALGYFVSYGVIGAIGFPGLLSNFYGPIRGYMGIELDIASLITVLYGIATLLLFALHKVLRKVERRRSPA